jgi:predicted outer membrane repeat protein
VRSQNGSNNCIIDCNGSEAELHRAFYFHRGEDANAILDGLTIINGYEKYPSNGGAILCENSNPTIINCTFIGNSAYRGGAIYNNSSSPAITNCTFSSNVVKSEGGSAYGGAIYNESSEPTITNCTFTGNSASWGSAIGNDSSEPIITNCSFRGNWASLESGAILNNRSNPVITNCILWGNDPPVAISNWNNANPVITYSNVQGGWEGEGNINKEPNFAFGTDLHLTPASPCIDTGDPNYIQEPNETDLDGNPRIAGGCVDMGAYEFPATPYIVVSDKRITFIKDRPSGLEKTLEIRNCGPGKLKWGITEDCPWLGVSPEKGVSSGEVNEVTLTADAGGLSVGEYRCQLTIADRKASNSPVTIDVILHIGSTLNVPAEYLTIQAAIDVAGDWDTVLVADGVYKGVGNRDIDFKGKKIQLKSENGAENCVIDCNGSSLYGGHRGFYFHSGEDADSILDGLTIISGYAYDGGGIYCGESSPTITNCIFTGNSARSPGGAMYNSGRDSVIANCTFSGNWATRGGAIYNVGRNSAITNCTFSGNLAGKRYKYASGGAIYNVGRNSAIANCTFTDNSADTNGGAIHNNGGNPAITNCAFIGNSAYWGGAIYSGYSETIITNCSFTGNSAEYGGAMYKHGRNSVVTNCTFSNNSAALSGGAMFDEWGNSAIINCTFSGNLASSSGGAIFNDDSSTTVTSCILWGNSYEQIYGSGVTVTYSDVQGGWAGVGNIENDPLFTDPYNGDYHLYEDSPCIDAGDPNYIPGPNETDLDGNPRVVGGRIDMGAYEFNHIPVADAGSDQTVYAWFDGMAKVMLDGTGSYDDDGQPLTYLWRWNIDGNDFTTAGPSPIIELPVGEHTIELTVNDGIDDSEPDEVVITVLPPIETAVRLTPKVLNIDSHGKWVKAHFVMPEGYSIYDVDVNTPATMEPLGIKSEYINVFINEAGLVEVEIGFARAAVCLSGLNYGPIEIAVVGVLTSGQYFYGIDTIRVTANNLNRIAVFASHWLESGCGVPDWCSGTDLDYSSTVNFIDFTIFDSCCIEVVEK